MIGMLRGKIEYQQDNWAILEVNDVGYKVFYCGDLKTGSEVKLFIHHHIKEDVNALYGFLTINEMGFFETLLTVSGVGPKMAMAILNTGSIDKVKRSIIQGDTTFLCSISGVGKKLAAKIIVELKGKMAGNNNNLVPQDSGEDADLVAALEQLGYKQSEILNAIKDLPDEVYGTQARLTWALQKMKK